MIQVACHQCQRSFSVADQHAGKSGKCPGCQTVLPIPAPQVAQAKVAAVAEEPLLANLAPVQAKVAAKPSPSLTREQLSARVLGAFQGTIEPVTTSLSYRLGVLLVSLVMLILPAIYLTLIVAVAYGVYLHFVHDAGMLEIRGGGRAKIFVFLLYVAPGFIGGMLVFFMIKPLFAPAGKRHGTRSLTRDGEPLLFDFVDRICQAVGSPKPRRIDVDCEVNASASFRNGLLSMFTRDLVLTIGVPLAGGMTMRQFAGVIAHEFGHFSQGTGMRLSYLVRTINAWFQRVVYERDSWDEWLDDTARSVDLRIGIFLYATMLFVWLTRKILWVLMMVGHAASSFFMREMEYDADRYEARLVGSDAFASSQTRIVTLSLANNNARGDLREFMREGRLGDNLPKLILENARQFTPESHRKIGELIAAEKTSWFDTHPSSPDRIASAEREQTPGIFHLDLPASQLFSNFDALGKNVTWDLYRIIFGQKFSSQEMHNTDELIARMGKTQQNNEAIDRYFQGCFTVLRSLQLPASRAMQPPQPQKTLDRLKQARAQMLAKVERYLELLKQYDTADSHLLELKQATELLHGHVSLKAKDYQVPVGSFAVASRAREDAQILQGRLSDEMHAIEQLIGDRLYAALQLLFVPQVAARVENATVLQEECRKYHESLISLQPQLSAVIQLRNEHNALGGLLGALQQNRNSEALVDSIQRSMREVFRVAGGIRDDLLRIPYPFDHAKGATSIGAYCAPNHPISDDLGSIYETSGGILESCIPIYVRLVGHLVAIAEQVELAVGLPRLEKRQVAS